MSHNIDGYIARQEDFVAENVHFRSLPQGFGFALDMPGDFKGDYAHVRTNYFGGFGDQGAICIIDGQIAYDYYENFTIPETKHDTDPYGPINRSLHILGVECEGSDEFDALQLGRFRSNEDFGLEEI